LKMSDEKKKGAHSDNDLTEVQEIMKDNDIPFYHSKEEDDEAEDREKD